MLFSVKVRGCIAQHTRVGHRCLHWVPLGMDYGLYTGTSRFNQSVQKKSLSFLICLKGEGTYGIADFEEFDESWVQVLTLHDIHF